jgi:uncharacterized protein (TIGR02266 family)
VTDEPREARDPLGLLSDFHRSTRMPLDAVVRLHFEGTVAYQNGFAANVSALGMFVKHPDPPAIGTRLVFEFVLGEERKPVQGGGIVTWARERYEGPGRPAGVGIQFTELDALSRQHIAEALFEFLETQLGVDVADHPDVPNLLAAIPTSTVVEMPGEDAAPAGGADEPQAELGFEASDDAGAAVVPRPAAAAPAPFRLFGDSPAGGGSFGVDEAETPREELFSPLTPPEPMDLGESSYGAARSRERPLWQPLAIAAGIAAAGFAGWWFLAGPGAEARQTAAPPPVTAAEPAPAPRPPLDPQPGPGTTLAEAVGAMPPEAASPAAGTEAEATAEEPVVPAATTPPARAAAAAPPATAPAAGRATRVTDIRWRAVAGGTDVTLVGDGDFRAGSYRWFEMRDARPRVLVRLVGMAAGYPRASLDAGTLELAGIRVGYHEKPGGNELHVVLDLSSLDIEVAGVEASGGELLVRLRQP